MQGHVPSCAEDRGTEVSTVPSADSSNGYGLASWVADAFCNKHLESEGELTKFAGAASRNSRPQRYAESLLEKMATLKKGMAEL